MEVQFQIKHKLRLGRLFKEKLIALIIILWTNSVSIVDYGVLIVSPHISEL